MSQTLEGFISHRLPIGEAALKRGDEVYVVAPFDTEALSLSERGFKLIDFPISAGCVTPAGIHTINKTVEYFAKSKAINSAFSDNQARALRDAGD